MDSRFLPISALQHHAFCPRQFALIHVEQAWAENRHTADGKILHERVDAGGRERRGKLRYERAVQISSGRFGIVGKMDLLEIEAGSPPKYFPVEYKRGKPKVEDWDRIQLCAQAMCIEEMRNVSVSEGALWYWQTRKRESVPIDSDLRKVTKKTIDSAREALRSGITPPPLRNQKRCRSCSLFDLCEPKALAQDTSASYVAQLGSGE